MNRERKRVPGFLKTKTMAVRRPTARTQTSSVHFSVNGLSVSLFKQDCYMKKAKLYYAKKKIVEGKLLLDPAYSGYDVTTDCKLIPIYKR